MHVVVQDRSVRQAEVEGGETQELYHPLIVLEGPPNFRLDDMGRFVLAPMYYSDDPFPEFQPGTTFTVREGAKIVGHGVVLDRSEPLGR